MISTTGFQAKGYSASQSEVEDKPESEREVEIRPEPVAEEVRRKRGRFRPNHKRLPRPPKEESISLNVVEKEEEETLTSDEHGFSSGVWRFDPTLELSKFKMPGLDHLVNHGMVLIRLATRS